MIHISDIYVPKISQRLWYMDQKILEDISRRESSNAEFVLLFVILHTQNMLECSFFFPCTISASTKILILFISASLQGTEVLPLFP